MVSSSSSSCWSFLLLCLLLLLPGLRSMFPDLCSLRTSRPRLRLVGATRIILAPLQTESVKLLV
jgi:hypothetical protein